MSSPSQIRHRYRAVHRSDPENTGIEKTETKNHRANVHTPAMRGRVCVIKNNTLVIANQSLGKSFILQLESSKPKPSPRECSRGRASPQNRHQLRGPKRSERQELVHRTPEQTTRAYLWYHLLEGLLPDIGWDCPGREDMACAEDCLHFLDRPALGLREHEKDLHEGHGCKHHVCEFS